MNSPGASRVIEMEQERCHVCGQFVSYSYLKSLDGNAVCPRCARIDPDTRGRME